jgi:hypothetical protein
MKKKGSSPLVEAAQAFDDALDAHARACELFARAPLAGARQIERANELLTEIAAAEERLRDTGAALATAVGEARDRQERSAHEVLGKLPQIQERNTQLQALLADFGKLAEEAGALNNAAVAAAPGASAARDLAPRLTELAGRAAELAEAARGADFEELASQAHSLHQRMLAAAKKLASATL